MKWSIGAREHTEKLVIALVLAVVLPSLLLSGFSFWAMRQQQQWTQLAARHRTSVLLNETERELRTKLDGFTNRLTEWLSKVDIPPPVDALEAFRSSAPLIHAVFLLDLQGQISYPPAPSPSPQQVGFPDSPEWQAAQKLEFVGNDPARAIQAYQELAIAQSQFASYAQAAIARCATKLGDRTVAQQTYLALLERAELPTLLRLGAYDQLVELSQQPDDSAQIAVNAVQWMVDCSNPDDYQTCAYYRERMVRRWEDLPAESISSELAGRWQETQERWLARYSGFILRAELEEDILPILSASLGILSADSAQYMPVHTSKGWQMLLLHRLSSGGYLGTVVALSALEAELLNSLNRRLQELGESAQAQVLTDEVAAPTAALASLRLPPPWNFWQLVALPTQGTSISRWQARLFLWGIVLCAVTILSGVYLLWRHMQREQALSRLKTDFVSNVSHELKTPLTSIRMFVETLRLKRYQDSMQAEEYLTILQQETERLTRLVDRVLDFSRMERGRRQYEFVETDLSSLVQETVNAFRGQMDEGEACEVVTQILPNIPMIPADRDAIAEVLWNLLHNAVKYSHPPKWVHVMLKHTDDRAQLTVQDNGIGIPRREQKQIFERFYRVDDSLTREVEGSGLGLAMVKHIVEAHGGEITVDSQVGEGSRFIVSLPSKQEDGNAPDKWVLREHK